MLFCTLSSICTFFTSTSDSGDVSENDSSVTEKEDNKFGCIVTVINWLLLC